MTISATTAALGSTPEAFDFDHLSIVPRVASTLVHRADARPAVRFGPVELSVPLLGSPMPDVCGPEMCNALAHQGALGLLHRFQTVAEQADQYARVTAALSAGTGAGAGAAVGITGDFRGRASALHQSGCRVFCLDTANGAHSQVAVAVTWIREQLKDAFLVAGNVASAEAFTWLEDLGVDAIRVGIAGGSVCETRTETGVYVPTPYAVMEAVQVRKRALIIGDSGVRTPADMCKLLALGADVVMVGSALAGTGEAPGRVIVVEGKKYKIMRGAASFSVQQQAGRDDPYYVEGAETMVPYKGGVAQVVQRYLAGLRSSMSYCDARSLADFRANARFVMLR